MDQNEEKKDSNPDTKGKEIDLKKILLSTKEVHTPEVAARVNAGVLLEQEQQAAKEGMGTAEGAAGSPSPPDAVRGSPLAPSAPSAKAPEPKKEESVVKQLETYRGDIESVVQEKNISVVSIAAAEAVRRAQTPQQAPARKEPRRWIGKSMYIAGGVVLILIVAVVWLYIAARQAPVPTTATTAEAPFITVDSSEAIAIVPGTRASLMETLNNARLDVKEPVGLIEWLYLAVPGTDAQGNVTQTEFGIQDLLNILAPEAPQSLVRTLQPTYMLGVHSYDENEAFLIMQTDSYETAYAGMLSWETTMQTDLSPLFDRTPPVHVVGTATSTEATSTTVLPGSFTDQVVDNRDARVIENQYGDILLLWTFLDRNTIVIANNEETLREIISRVTTPASTGLQQ